MPEIDLTFRPVSYWPEAEPPDEIDIATISVESVLGDEVFVIAEPADGVRIRYSARQDGATYEAQPPTSDRPLSLGELIALIDGIALGENLTGLVHGVLALNEMIGSGNAEHADFVSVSSEFYPQLFDHYAAKKYEWVMEGRDGGA
jgi:hypothetical protein